MKMPRHFFRSPPDRLQASEQAGLGSGVSVAAIHCFSHNPVQAGMADLHLLAPLRSIRPYVPAGGVQRIILRPGINLAANPGLGYADFREGPIRGATGVGGGKCDIMPSQAEVLHLEGFVPADDAVQARSPQVAQWPFFARCGRKEHSLAAREGAHIPGRENFCPEIIMILRRSAWAIAVLQLSLPCCAVFALPGFGQQECSSGTGWPGKINERGHGEDYQCQAEQGIEKEAPPPVALAGEQRQPLRMSRKE